MMSTESQEIKIIGIDKEAIRVSLEKNNFCTILFKFSLKPDQSWEQKFYEVQQKNTSAMKRKAHLIGSTISVEVSNIDDLQKVLDVIKIEVTETNVLREADYQKKMKIHQELEALQQKQRDATQKFKEDSDKLVF
ncbi:MAG: hypothetical protein NT079_00640 [Candidatus Omnitrophica bacterium]|nr:hypothetical protein [Candidatus Omnitrophota bacterium]